MTATTTSDKPGQTIQVLGLLHFLIAAIVLVIGPKALNGFLNALFSSRTYVWVRQGELPGWPISDLDKFFLATPYWTSYQPGWLLGLISPVIGTSIFPATGIIIRDMTPTT